MHTRKIYIQVKTINIDFIFKGDIIYKTDCCLFNMKYRHMGDSYAFTF